MSNKWVVICGISIACWCIVGVIRLLLGEYGTIEYRVLVNLQIMFSVPSVMYALLSIGR